MIESKAWKWEIVKGSDEDYWKEPSIESYYLINRWQKQDKKIFLDLGCGLGRHTVQFAKSGFNTFAFDLSEKSIEATKEWVNRENLNVDFKICDMINLPYEKESFDCILCRNVISHTDTEGMKKIVSGINRILKDAGECYLTLGSKETWHFKQNWPAVDENTKIRIEDGPENGIPHFYADEKLISELFKDFEIVIFQHMEDFRLREATSSNWHYYMLIKKK